MQNTKTPKIGEVYSVQFDGEGSVQSGMRPGVVFQNNVGNAYSPNVVVLPLTTNLKKRTMPTHVVVRAADTGLARDSMVLCENPQCVPKDKLGKYITKLPDYYMSMIARASLMASGAIAYMNPNDLVSAWENACALNLSGEEVA